MNHSSNGTAARIFRLDFFWGEFEHYHLVYMSGGKAQLSAKPKCASKAPVCEQGPTVSVARFWRQKPPFASKAQL